MSVATADGSSARKRNAKRCSILIRCAAPARMVAWIQTKRSKISYVHPSIGPAVARGRSVGFFRLKTTTRTCTTDDLYAFFPLFSHLFHPYLLCPLYTCITTKSHPSFSCMFVCIFFSSLILRFYIFSLSSGTLLFSVNISPVLHPSFPLRANVFHFFRT